MPATSNAQQRDTRRRADAERSIAAILDAGLACFGTNPDVTMTAVARAAGVGRVTLYAHFPSRQALLEALMAHAIAQANQALELETPDDEPASQTLAQLIRSSWRILDRHRSLLAAATRELGLARVRKHHDQVLDRVDRLIQQGQDEGSVRSDLPRTWLVTTFYSLMHAAADEVDTGRLPHAAAANALQATLLSALAPTPPSQPVTGGSSRSAKGGTAGQRSRAG
jgi:AcrR family transcriptional regulator